MSAQSDLRFYRAARVANDALDGWLPDHAVAVSDGRIVDVVRGDQAAAGATTDLGDVSLLPGLVEAHTHVSCPPRVDAFDVITGEPSERPAFRAAAAVGAVLRSGVTTMRDLGAPNDIVFPLRDAIADGVVPGPRLLAAGAPITRTTDHCWFWGGEADTPEQVRAAAQRRVDLGADVIKVMASGGNFTPTSNPRWLQYPSEVLRIIVETGRSAGIEVAAHTHSAAGVRASVEAGVRHLIHGRWLSDDPERSFDYDPALGQRIADEGVWVNPTIGLGLLASEARERGDATPRRNPNLSGPSPREEGLEILRDLRDRGVRFTSGLDMGMAYADFHLAAAEARAFGRDLGFSPWQCIRLMTCDSAEALGWGDKIGRLRRGYEADLAAFAGDPGADAAQLHAPTAVIQAGRLLNVRGGLG